jgi:hypothetical protein
MSISVANFLTQYIRPTIASVTEFPDASLGYWIDAALIDISRSFPRKTYALWDATTNLAMYTYADSLSAADETNIIRILHAIYPYGSFEKETHTVMNRKSHLDEDFLGGNYYDPDNDLQVLYVGMPVVTGEQIYADAHIYWATSSGNLINPKEHYDLIRLYVIWQAYHQRMTNQSAAAVPDSSLFNSLALEAWRAERSYRAAYTVLDEAKATSGVAIGWKMDKWDK